MALRPTTVRLSDRTWQYVKAAAEQDGVSANAWVAEAVISRLVYQTLRDNPETFQNWERVHAVVAEVCRDGLIG